MEETESQLPREVEPPHEARSLVVLVDEQARILLAEGAALAHLGVAGRRLVGRSALTAFARFPAVGRTLARALAGRSSSSEVALLQPLVLVGEPRRDPQGRVIGALLTGVSDGVDGNGLRLHERGLLLFLRALPGGVWATDRSLRITNAFGRLGAGGLFDVPGRTIQELLGTDDPQDVAIAGHQAALGGTRTQFRYRHLERWYEVLVEPLRDAEGAIQGTVAAALDVTDRIEAEESVARSESRLSEAQRTAHVGSFEWDLATDCISLSEELCNLHGIAPADFDGRLESFVGLVHPDDREEAAAAIRAAMQAGGPFTHEHRILRHGEERILKTRGRVVLDRAGRPVRLSGSAWDVTEARRATRALERTVSLLTATLDATADGILVVERDGRIAAVNPRFVTLWRIPTHLLAHHDDEELLAYVADQLESPEQFLAGVHALYHTPERESLDVLRFRDGRVYERYSRPQRLGEEIVGRVWSFRDITGHERLLRQAVILADASRLLASLDVDGALGALARLVVPALGEACAIEVHGDGGPTRVIGHALDPGRALPVAAPDELGDCPSLRFERDGVQHLAVPLRAQRGSVGTIVLAAARDARFHDDDVALAEEIARRASLSLENARLLRDTHDALRAREEFLTIAAHEIRGPLTAMHLAAQGLHELLPTGVGPRLLETIEREDRRLARFVDELLDLGRLRRGELQIELSRVDLGKVVRATAGEFEHDASRAGSTLAVEAPDGIIGRWDHERIAQVVTHVLDNAIKFGRGRPIELTVCAVDGVGGARLAELRVRDHGIGVPLEAQKPIFEPFERAVPSRHYGGLGLGLFIARTIVESVGGHISVESKAGEGATFIVQLPRELP